MAAEGTFANEDEENDSEYEYSDEDEPENKDDDILMKEGNDEAAEKPKKRRKLKGPKLEKVLEDDDFLPELRLKNELLLK
jgi:hypothetical protein